MDSSTLLTNHTRSSQRPVGAIKRVPWTTDAIGELIKVNSVVLFARGSVEEPKCGFTARTIDYLHSNKIDFLCIDVLADKSLIPAITALYGRRNFPLVVADDRLIDNFDDLQFAIESISKVANA